MLSFIYPIGTDIFGSDFFSYLIIVGIFSGILKELNKNER